MSYKIYRLSTFPQIIYFIFVVTTVSYANIDFIAANGLDIANKFTQQGITYQQKHDWSKALDCFSRALLLNPENLPARENLLRINKAAGISDELRIKLFLIEDLFYFIDRAQLEISTVTQERNKLAISLVQKTNMSEFIRLGLKNIQKEFTLPEQNWQLNNDSKQPLETLCSALINEKERLSYYLKHRKNQYSWLRTIEQQPTEEFFPHQQYFQEIKTQDLPFADPWKEITKLRDELSAVREQLGSFKSDMDIKNQRITNLTKEIIEFSLKLAEKEMVLGEKVDALNSLHTAYTDLQSRLTLGLKIIEEKNIQIQSLQESLASLQDETISRGKEVDTILSSKDKTIGEWEDILTIYQKKLKEATENIEIGNIDIANLHEQLAVVQTRLFEKETALERIKGKLAILQIQIK